MGQHHHTIYSTPIASDGIGSKFRDAADRRGAWRLVEKATAARDVPPGQSWAFTGHRSMAKVIADEAAQKV